MKNTELFWQVSIAARFPSGATLLCPNLNHSGHTAWGQSKIGLHAVSELPEIIKIQILFPLAALSRNYTKKTKQKFQHTILEITSL